MNLKTFVITILSLLITVSVKGNDFLFNEVSSFVKAKPIWPEGNEKKQNMTVSFRRVFHVKSIESANLKIAASTDYRAYVNGKFLAHGPCVAAHDYYRIDSYEITNLLKPGDNIVSIEVSGYNTPSYYLLDQPSFLQAEVVAGNKVITASGTSDDFSAYILNQRKPDVPRFSFQRPFTEYYILSSDYNQWMTDASWNKGQPVSCAIQPEKKLLPRGVPYPDYSILRSSQISDSLYVFTSNSTGFIGLSVKVKKPSKITLFFDELLSNNDVNYKRLGTESYIVYDLQPGDYTLETFEPYTLKYLKTKIEGEGDILMTYMRSYVNSDVHRAEFESNDVGLNFLFETARETFRQNALDIFMDCPSRERAGWLCDSYFSARVAFDLSGYTWIEHNFLQNFLLPDTFKDIPHGMLPMCYPSDHPNNNFIPNWAMWFVLELEEYAKRSTDKVMIEALKPKVYDLIEYFKPFKNKDGLLEKLDKWVFVEWSAANSFVQDVNYPSNMLYAGMLDAAGNIYNDSSLKKEAEKVRKVIRKQSFDGQFFSDNAVRKNGKLEVQRNNQTEVCQYYAFYFNVATPELYPELWQRLLNEFGPKRKINNPYPSIHFANAFIGNYLRLEILSRYGHIRQLMNESLDEYLIMAKTTGTLWENMTTVASCNHGFASHIAHVFYRDILGVKNILPNIKKIEIKFTDTDLKSCKGKIPVGPEYVTLEWVKKDNVISYSLNIPEGYEVTIENASNCSLHKQ
ncbi:family 78 glycoside hydrolase catalytic domain [Parabacteroides sp. AM08-6]|uniref:alpha-L-rhamnosidase-related protein n=1 Tax=Parabacteroides sp. AM08-6 TaxID=2292053 RepID=UPI000EFFB329|nr:family 78 glycoside hydrolase catalytic domain [Parabacteroides sp. AM08-6]RHJ82451.1 hypothetical protein DW103_09835 [Parabacteroides sp. AM08-6]